MKIKQNYVSNLTRGFSTVDIVNIYNTQTYGRYYKPLLHDSRNMHCLLITINGHGDIVLKDNTLFSVAKNKVFIGTLSKIKALQSNGNNWHFIIYWFIPMNIELPENTTKVIKNINLQSAEEEANNLITLLKTFLATKIYYANSVFYCFLCKILEEQNPYTFKNDKIIQEAIKYINEHIKEPIRISDISNEFGYCEKHIRHLFSTTLKISPKQYILKVKLDDICHMLSNTNISINDLSEMYSFNSVNHLCNTFKKVYGLTPSEFRNNTNKINNDL